MYKNQGKWNALLGGLLVFIIPLIGISVVYFTASRLPKSKEVPILKAKPSLVSWNLNNSNENISDSTYWKDVLILFSIDSLNQKQRVELLKELTESTVNHPPFSLKEPYGQLLFLGVADDTLSWEQTPNNWSLYNTNPSLPFRIQDSIYLIDKHGNVRGQYLYNESDIDSLKIDAELLLRETYYDNRRQIRIKTLFKTPTDVENEK